MIEPDGNLGFENDGDARVPGQNRNHQATSRRSAVAPGMLWEPGNFSAAANNLRELTGDLADASLASLEHTRRMIEDVQGARRIDDLLVIQARYLTSLCQTLAEQSHRFGYYLAEVPRDVSEASRDLVEATVEAMQDVSVVTASGLAATAVLVQSAPGESNAL